MVTPSGGSNPWVFLGVSHFISHGRVSGSLGWQTLATFTGEVVQVHRPPKVSAGGTLF